jgi:hypothetical protein
MKDRRWFVIASKPVTPALLPRPEVGGLVMITAAQPMPFPLEFEGAEQSPLSVYHSENPGAVDSTPQAAKP